MRIILYTGKGGVGKTSIASATAVKAASLGYKTLIVSTDSAHSLGDSLDTPLTGAPAMVAENLWAQEIDVHHDLGSNWSTVRTWLAALMRWHVGSTNATYVTMRAYQAGHQYFAHYIDSLRSSGNRNVVRRTDG